jgi:hypothetical protein
MKKFITAILLTALLGVFVFVGCSKECEDCPNNVDTLLITDTLTDTLVVTDTDTVITDPPLLIDVNGPTDLVVGAIGDFSCDVASMDNFIAARWDLDPRPVSYDYYIMPGQSEGSFTPTGTMPWQFTETNNGLDVSGSFDKRGIYTTQVHIEGNGGFTDKGGVVVYVSPETPDTSANPQVIRAGLEEEVLGSDFEFLKFSYLGKENISDFPVSVSADAFNEFKTFNNFFDLNGGQPRIARTTSECYKFLRIEGMGYYYAIVKVDFDIFGSMLVFGDDPNDYIDYSVYVSAQPVLPTTFFPEVHYLYYNTFTGGSGDAYCINSNNVVTDTITVEGSYEYNFTFGMKITQHHSNTPSSGTAICFDGPGMTRLNNVKIFLEK